MTISEKLNRCMESVRSKISFRPELALILGSGLGDYAEGIEIAEVLDYAEIDGFPVSTVAGHKGRFVFGHVNQVPVVIMQGRVHYYEGYAASDVVLPVRLMGLMGAKKLILTNAAGAVNVDYRPGDFMMIADQITMGVPNPLIGPNPDELGVRFPDMSDLYSSRMRKVIRRVAEEKGIALREGVYVQMTGPSYETPAEVRMARILGGDAVGMSTACEATAAHHMGMEVCGISCMTNMAAGVTEKPLSHQEVQETADRIAEDFKRLITGVICAV